MADTAWGDEFLVPGYEGEEHLKAGEFVYSLAMALRPLSETQQTILLQCMRPLFEQVKISAVPKTFKGMGGKLGLSSELERKLCRIDYCDGSACGFMQLVPLERREIGRLPLCEVCDRNIYKVTPGPNPKFQPKVCDYVIDPYETITDFLNRPDFLELYEEQWVAVDASIKSPDKAPTDKLGNAVYNDWLNGQARRFFRYARDRCDPGFLKYDRGTDTRTGTIFIFVMDIADYMSSATNIQSTKGAQSFGGFVSKLLSLPASCRNLSDWTFSDQVYNDGKKAKNPLQRQEWRLRSALEWRKGRVVKLTNGRSMRVHIVHMWWQGDGPMLEEMGGRYNFKNPNWWWQHSLNCIDVQELGGKSRHIVFPYLLNGKEIETRNTPEMIDNQALEVEKAYAVDDKTGKAAAQANGAHWRCAFAGGLTKSRNLPALEYFEFDHFTVQGWDHIHAGVIKQVIELVTKGLSPAARDAIAETIQCTQTARGEPRLCNWLVDGHNKIHTILNWFLHDALYHLWRVLPEEELQMVTMLWLHLVHIRSGAPTEKDLEISELARTNYELIKELNFGMPTAKPNDVKLLRAEFSVREFMTLPTSSELVVDSGMKTIMLSLRKLMSNGSAMKGAMKR